MIAPWMLAGGTAAALAALAKRGLDNAAAADDLRVALAGELPARLGKWAREIALAAVAHSPGELDAHTFARFVAAVMDRESNGGQQLVPRGPAGTGDNGHGLGLMQLDDRAHPGLLEKPELWQSAEWNVDTGAAELAALFARTDAARDEQDRLQRAAAAYNSGPRALTAADPDAHTTGGDYGRDVLARLSQYA